MKKAGLLALVCLIIPFVACGPQEGGPGDPAPVDEQPGGVPDPSGPDPPAETRTASPPDQPAEAAGEPTGEQAQLQKSLETWQTLKAQCGGNYAYKVRWSSWVGFGHETQIVVRDNRVAERRYREWSGQPVPVEPGQPPKPEGETWTETGDQLGSHPKGAAPKTLDQLYEEAAKVLAKTLAPHERLYLRFDDSGLLKSCFYVDTRIADDAPQTGVVIGSIELQTVQD
jgi:hypothetical protein